MSDTKVGGAPHVLFVRSATGLLREVRLADQWVFNAFMLNLGLAGVYLFEFGPWARPSGNLFLITVIGTLGFACVAATYALLSSAFPRTGGDYVFNTRVLGGGVGFWSSWVVFVVFASIGGASVAWFFAHSGVPFALSLVARVSSSEAIQSWASASAGTGWTTVTATTLILLSALALIKGLGFLMRIQRWLFLIGIAGLLLAIGLLAFTSSGEFATRYDESVSEVNRRTNTPVRATIIVTVLVESFLLAAQYIEKMLTFFVAASFMVNVGMTITCAAGALFPYVKKDLFDRSPANVRWAGIPVITIVGGVATVVMLITDIQFLTVKELFVNTREMWWYAGVTAVLGVVLYLGAKTVRRSQGTDLSLTFAEIPPE